MFCFAENRYIIAKAAKVDQPAGGCGISRRQPQSKSGRPVGTVPGLRSSQTEVGCQRGANGHPNNVCCFGWGFILGSGYNSIDDIIDTMFTIR